MRLTRVQKKFLENLNTLNAAGVTPNVLQVAVAGGDNPSWGQILYRYKVYKQLAAQGLVGDLGSGRTRALRITRDGLRAVKEIQ